MITASLFGKTPQGETVHSYLIQNSRGCCAEIIDYSLTLRRLCVPDASSRLTDVVLAYPEPTVPMDGGFVGITVGRVANRISGAQFSIDGKNYAVTANEGTKCLHGGKLFCEKLWKVEAEDENTLVARCVSEDGEDGFPGRLEVTVRIRFTDENELEFVYSALGDQTTPVNLTNHAYYNLMGAGTVLEHTLQIDAAYTTEADETLIPTGRLLPVAGTPFDFTTPKKVGRDIDQENAQLKIGGGYDHNFVLNGSAYRHAAQLSAPNGIQMDVFTDAPCMQLYTANFLERRDGKDRVHEPRCALCLETQGYPDAVNKPMFPSILLKAGQRYESRTSYVFGLSK